MTIYSLYIYDRHCQCVYYQDWHRSSRPRPATEQGMLSGVSRAMMTSAAASTLPGASLDSQWRHNSPRNTLSSASGVVVAMNDGLSHEPVPAGRAQSAPTNGTASASSSALPFDEEAKLVFGVIFSLRNMVKKLSGNPKDEQFTSYRTSTYRLHLFETVSGYKFVMLSDPITDSLRFALRQIYQGPFLEYVVRNPLMVMDSHEHGIDNDFFRTGTDRLVRGLSTFA